MASPSLPDPAAQVQELLAVIQIAPDPLTEEFSGTSEGLTSEGPFGESGLKDVPDVCGIKKGRGCIGTEKGH